MTSPARVQPDRYERLAMVARAFTADLGVEEIARIVMQQGMAGMNASGSAVLFVDGDQVHTVAVVGSTARSIQGMEWQGGFGTMSLDRPNPICVSIRQADEVWVSDREDGIRRFPDLAKSSAQSQGWAALPLLSRGRTFGAFSLSFTNRPAFDDLDRDYIRTLTDVAALALSRFFEARALTDPPAGQRAAEEVATAMLAASTDGIVAVDGAGTIVQCNDRLCELLGYQAAELIGRSVEVLLPSGQREVHARLRRGYVDDPVPRSMESGLDLVARRSDGVEIPVDISLSPCATRIGFCVIAVVRPRG